MSLPRETRNVIRQLYRQGFKSVPMRELRELWSDLANRRVMYSGMTHAELTRKYGQNNLVHVAGVGWYKR